MSLITFCPNFVEKRYFVLVDKRTRSTVISCTLCEKDRTKDGTIAAFNFERVKAAVGWAALSFMRRSLIPNKPYNMCNHVKLDFQREKEYPLITGEDLTEV